MAKKISLTDIDVQPCHDYFVHIMNKYGRSGKFDPMDVFEAVPSDKKYYDVMWLLRRCPKARTREMFKYYFSLNPTFDSISWGIYAIKQMQTKKMMSLYKSKKPRVGDVGWLITVCEYAQTSEMLEYYMSLNPDEDELFMLRHACEYARLHLDEVINRK